MKTLSELKDTLQAERPYLEKRYHLASMAVFGSFARGEQEAGSDLDLLVTFHETPSLLTLINMEHYLSDKLGVAVDVIMASSLKEPVAESAMARYGCHA